MSAFLRREHAAIFVLLVAALAVGALTVSDYGDSWDEATLFRYSQYTMQSYPFLWHPADLPASNDTLPQNGPGYVTAVSLVAPYFSLLEPTWSVSTTRHFIYFLTFLGGAFTFYLLSRRWVSEAASVGATLLLISQPLFWGHAFINPKDLAFLAFFTATIHAGLSMVESHPNSRWFGARVLLVAVLLGITSSMRVAGPVAGLLVLAYGAYRNRWKIIGPAAACIIIAAAITYLSWPYLWGAPLEHYLESSAMTTDFPGGGRVLFNGAVYAANELPRLYFPTLMAIQVTEPALLLGVFGLALAAIQFARAGRRGPLPLILIWFVVPVMLVVGLHSRLYDNGRQLYFTLPPLFLAAALALDKVLAVLQPLAGKAAIAVIISLPGMVAGMGLHPYEYVYYNSLVGGTPGAYGRFEMDYWGTSSKEMMEYINSIARGRTTVLAPSAQDLMKPYARHIVDVYNGRHDEQIRYDYIAILIRAGWNGQSCSFAPVVHTIGRMGATFALLRASPQGEDCSLTSGMGSGMQARGEIGRGPLSVAEQITAGL
jgi:hypothetical protein